jgi:CHASE3 domain sensor protein
MKYSDKLEAALEAVETQDGLPGTVGIIEPLRDALELALAELELTNEMYEEAENDRAREESMREMAEEQVTELESTIESYDFDDRGDQAIRDQINRIKYLGLDSELSIIEVLEKLKTEAQNAQA